MFGTVSLGAATTARLDDGVSLSDQRGAKPIAAN
jgi:hypothetical protein